MVLAGQQGPKNAAYLITKLELADLKIPVPVHPGVQIPQPTEPVQLCTADSYLPPGLTSVNTREPQKPGVL